jgi:hypothetical protein
MPGEPHGCALGAPIPGTPDPAFHEYGIGHEYETSDRFLEELRHRVEEVTSDA